MEALQPTWLMTEENAFVSGGVIIHLSWHISRTYIPSKSGLGMLCEKGPLVQNIVSLQGLAAKE